MLFRWTPKAATLVASLLILLLPAAASALSLPTGFINDPVVSGLNEPTSMAFLPDGRILVIEQRTGKVRMIVNGHVAVQDPVFVVPNLVNTYYEQGLQGIAIDPGWPTRPYVYLYYTRTGSACRLVRYHASGDLYNPAGETLTLENPLLLIDDVPDHTRWHQAGCLRFGPDGKLYLSLGEDDENPCNAIDSTSLRGQIVRLSVDALPVGGGGQVLRSVITPPDNPLSTPDSNAKLVYAYGFRNPWRFHIDSVTNRLYVCDVGESDYEEFDEVKAGDYLGWPYREGYLIMPRPTCPEPGGEGNTYFKAPIAVFPHRADLTAVFAAGTYRQVPGGGSNWPNEYDGDAFYGEYYSGDFYRLKVQGLSWAPAPPVPGQPDTLRWATGLISAVDFHVGSDGSWWWLRQWDDSHNPSSGSIQRIRFQGSTSGVPSLPCTGSILGAPNPFSGSVELTIHLVESGPVRLFLYDLAGRRIRRLLDESLPAGNAHATWDGRDASGRSVPPGVYLARVECPGKTETIRILRLK